MGGVESRGQLHPGIAQVVFRPHFRIEFRPSRNWPDPGPSICRTAAPWRRSPLHSGTGGEFRGQGTHTGDAGDETIQYSRHRAESAMDRGERPASRPFLAETEYLAKGDHGLDWRAR